MPSPLALALLTADPDDVGTPEALAAGYDPEAVLRAAAEALGPGLAWKRWLHGETALRRAVAVAAVRIEDPAWCDLLLTLLVHAAAPSTARRGLAQAVARLLPRARLNRRGRERLARLVERAARKPETSHDFDAHFLVAALDELSYGIWRDLNPALERLTRHPSHAVQNAAHACRARIERSR